MAKAQHQIVHLTPVNVGGTGGIMGIRASIHYCLAGFFFGMLVVGVVFLIGDERYSTNWVLLRENSNGVVGDETAMRVTSTGTSGLKCEVLQEAEKKNTQPTTATTKQSSSSSSLSSSAPASLPDSDSRKSSSISSSSCDLFSGKWVFDNVSYPLYDEKECSFMSEQMACEKYGRKDLTYRYWKWQPHQCDLPRFNGTALLDKLRNKRLVYVGDSLNRGQWGSMICLIDKAVPNPDLKSVTYHLNGSLINFKAIEYNVSIEFYWAPLLVESNSDDPVHHRVPERIVRVQAIENHGRHWSNADYLVFDSYLWWRRPTMKVLWGSFERPEEGIYKEMEMIRSYEMALQTWSDWLEVHINRSTTKIFWVSMSPTHELSEEWAHGYGHPPSSNCYGETMPILGREGYWGSGSDPNMMRAVEKTVDRLGLLGLKVQILNITQMSEYRKDAHVSIYRKQWDPITDEQKANPVSYADCYHWCIPGVPDAWNELLYAFINDDSL